MARTAEILAIEERAAEYIAEDGLMRLTLNDDREPHPGQTLRTVQNENGILFATVFYRLLQKLQALEPTDPQVYADTVERLKHATVSGLFHRHPGNIRRREAQDNYAAICLGSVMFDLPEPRRIVSHGERHGYCYNNVSPSSFELGCVRQGGEIAFYKILAGLVPGLIEILWLIGGLLANAFQRTTHKDAFSNAQLAWVRVEALKLHFTKNPTALPMIMRAPLILALGVWDLCTRYKYGSVYGPTIRYYQSDAHPNVQLAKLLAKVER